MAWAKWFHVRPNVELSRIRPAAQAEQDATGVDRRPDVGSSAELGVSVAGARGSGSSRGRAPCLQVHRGAWGGASIDLASPSIGSVQAEPSRDPGRAVARRGRGKPARQERRIGGQLQRAPGVPQFWGTAAGRLFVGLTARRSTAARKRS